MPVALRFGLLVGHRAVAERNVEQARRAPVPQVSLLGADGGPAAWYRLDGGPGRPSEALVSVFARVGMVDPEEEGIRESLRIRCVAMSSSVPPPEQPDPRYPYPGPPPGSGPYPPVPGPYPPVPGPYPQVPGPYPYPGQVPYPGQQPYPIGPGRPLYPGPPAADPRAARRTGFGRALAATSLWAGLSLVLLLLLAGPPASAEAAGRVVGSLVFAALLAAVPTWLIVRRRPGGWPFWQVVLVALGFFVLLRLISVAGSVGA